MLSLLVKISSEIFHYDLAANRKATVFAEKHEKQWDICLVLMKQIFVVEGMIAISHSFQGNNQLL